nr:TIGR02234 family membrane protein [Streptacidiphilus sp. PB12-B1b]
MPPTAADARPAPDRRSLALMLLFAVVGAAVVLLAAGRTWARGEVAFQSSVLHVSATGSQTTGLPSALALVALASAVAVFAVRGNARRLVGGLLALAGAAVVAACVGAATGSAALDRRAAAAVGLSTATAGHVTHAAWPWAGAAGGVLLLLAGLLVIARGRDWPGMSSRYEAPERRRVGAGTAAAANRPDHTPADLWKALDRGEDPTA